MDKTGRDIFRAIHKSKWLEIEYRNRAGEETCYWISIRDIDAERQMITADGFNVSTHQLAELHLHYSSITDTNIVDGSACSRNDRLISDIETHPAKYSFIFQNISNLRLLNYYSDCNRLDSTPYTTSYGLVEDLDIDCIGDGQYHLTEKQFDIIVKNYHINAKRRKNSSDREPAALCMNLCSIHTRKGLYVLVYKRLLLDVINRTLVQEEEPVICREFTVGGEICPITRFLDAEEAELLEDYEKNAERIKDAVTASCPEYGGVDDMPYVMAISRDYSINLDREYSWIMESVRAGRQTEPIKAFFGNLTDKPRRYKSYPIALYNDKVNIDQLRAIHNGIRYPLIYVQGPPGTGKTNTILNTVITAFFNDRTVLLTSYNNHPMDEIYDKLSKLEYRGRIIPFPVIRLGNNTRVKAAVRHVRQLCAITDTVKVYGAALDRKQNDEKEKAAQLSVFLKNYEEWLDLTERREMIETMISSSTSMPLVSDLYGRQLKDVCEKIEMLGDAGHEDISRFIRQDREELLKYLYYTSARFIKKLKEPRNRDIYDIFMEGDPEDSAARLNQFLSETGNMKRFLRIFPIVVTTNISACRLGEPDIYFDMVIMDEASQCNTAVALVPILRGRQLMLVGDPQQLRPVILLNEAVNRKLRKQYAVPPEHDYVNKSVYQTFLACDAVSDEILLSYHYRCHPKIIEFNNRKYYNSKLIIKSEVRGDQPLLFVDCENSDIEKKNTSVHEAEEIAAYAAEHPDENIGVITPFVNQRKQIKELLYEKGLNNVECGTVHAFQGDEKDKIFFSLALSQNTGQKTYDWLKNNRELINVATSRAREELVILGDRKQIRRLHGMEREDDLYELCSYVSTEGKTVVSEKSPGSRALGIKPYTLEIEKAFMDSINHAMGAMMLEKGLYTVKERVAVCDVIGSQEAADVFYETDFDYVAYERTREGNTPVFAAELVTGSCDEQQMQRIVKKKELCSRCGFEFITVPGTYARRYYYAKQILSSFFRNIR
ncbi:MAG: DEAD/DEAH box helicase [Firmicutes bacterium]|nr:DEAD/DEAH box helicase [Bacillota bacterium]